MYFFFSSLFSFFFFFFLSCISGNKISEEWEYQSKWKEWKQLFSWNIMLCHGGSEADEAEQWQKRVPLYMHFFLFLFLAMKYLKLLILLHKQLYFLVSGQLDQDLSFCWMIAIINIYIYLILFLSVYSVPV